MTITPADDAADETTGYEPTHFLNYKGDRRAMGNAVGPTDEGISYFPVDATYDPKTDMTRVGLRIIGGVPRG